MNDIKSLLQELIHQLFHVDVPVELSFAPELDSSTDFRADLATNVCLRLAKTLKQSPRDLAEVLKSEFLQTAPSKLPLLSGVRLEVAGAGFLNFMLPDAFLKSVLNSYVADFLSAISLDSYRGKVVVTEFSDPNPFKVLHIGHLYTSVVGDSLSRLIEFAGAKVHRVNFGGDVGLHVGKTLFALSNAVRENPALATSFTIEDIAQYYVEGTRAYESSDSAKESIVALNKQIYDIAARDLHDSPLAELYWRGRTLSYEYFDSFYDRLGISFEKYYPESSVATRGVQEVQSHVPAVYSESNGALVFQGEPFGLHTRVFINSEGLPTYEAKDVGLLFTKFDDYSFDESIVITGNEQKEYMAVVLKSVEQFAPSLAHKTRHLTHGMVRLPGNSKMSSRLGNFIKAVDVLDAVTSSVSSANPSLSEPDLSIISLGAIKYSFLKSKLGGNLEFNLEESISMTGNSGVYLMYSVVRAQKILASLPESLQPSPANLSLNTQDSQDTSAPQSPSPAPSWALSSFEINLLKKFLAFPSVLSAAVSELSPHLLASFLFDLAQTFSRFYENCPVRSSDFAPERSLLVLTFKNIMIQGLSLLGISVPKEM